MAAPFLCRLLWHSRPEGGLSRDTLYWQCTRCGELVPGDWATRKQKSVMPVRLPARPLPVTRAR